MLLAFAARRRAASALAPALATHLHLVLAMKIVPTPQTLVGWGALSVSLGFALLAAALGVTYAYARRLTPRSRASQPCRSPGRRPAVE